MIRNFAAARRPGTTLRRLCVGLLTALLFGGFGILAAGTAAAHSFPVSSSPANGSSVATGPDRVSITFNENIQHAFPALTVVGPDGNLWSKGQPTIDGPNISVAIGELGPVGKYTIAYRVTSADGHPVSGTRTFTLTTPGNGKPGPKPGAASASSSKGGGSSGGVPIWVFVLGAVVLFGGGLAVALLGGKRSPKQR